MCLWQSKQKHFSMSVEMQYMREESRFCAFVGQILGHVISDNVLDLVCHIL